MHFNCEKLKVLWDIKSRVSAIIYYILKLMDLKSL